MLKKTVTYETFDGETVTEDLYFNISESELSDMQFSKAGGMSEYITQIYKTKDSVKIYNLFKELILKAYGIKSPDGKKFYKTDAIRTEFASSIAYDTVFSEIIRNPDYAVEFIRGIFPKKIMNDIPEDPNKIQELINKTKEERAKLTAKNS